VAQALFAACTFESEGTGSNEPPGLGDGDDCNMFGDTFANSSKNTQISLFGPGELDDAGADATTGIPTYTDIPAGVAFIVSWDYQYALFESTAEAFVGTETLNFFNRAAIVAGGGFAGVPYLDFRQEPDSLTSNSGSGEVSFVFENGLPQGSYKLWALTDVFHQVSCAVAARPGLFHVVGLEIQ